MKALVLTLLCLSIPGISQSQERTVDPRPLKKDSGIACQTVLKMTQGERVFYFFALLEGFKSANGLLKYVRENSKEPESKITANACVAVLESAILIPEGITLEEVQARAEIRCRRPDYANKQAINAWIEALQELQNGP